MGIIWSQFESERELASSDLKELSGEKSDTSMKGLRLSSHGRSERSNDLLFHTDATFEEVREAATRICRDYLTGRWKTVNPEQLIFKRISGGLSNYLYYVSLPGDDTRIEAASMNTAKNGNSIPAATDGTDTEPKQVLLRIYGQTHGGTSAALEGMITESVVFALLSERNFGPKLHGIFPGGRIEQFIPSRPLKTVELAIPMVSKKVAQKMGEIHSLDIPMSKEPNWIWNCMNRWLITIGNLLEHTNWDISERSNAQRVRDFNFVKETNWLKQVVESEPHDVLFCHNDMQEGNILYRESNINDLKNYLEHTQISESDGEENANSTSSNELDLMIIDFEYCAYNYRAFDLANHFTEWTIDYTSPGYPYYEMLPHQYPTEKQRYDFIETYLKKLNEQKYEYKPSKEEIELLMQEVEVFRMFSHLFWSLWSMVNVESNIDFGYWEYTLSRIDEYSVLKRKFIEQHSNQK